MRATLGATMGNTVDSRVARNGGAMSEQVNTDGAVSWVRAVKGESTGDFYDARDSEELSHESLADGVCEYLEGFDVDTWPSTLEVRVMSRIKVPVEQHAKALLSSLLEEVQSELGDPDGAPLVSASEELECLSLMTATVEAISKKGGPAPARTRRARREDRNVAILGQGDMKW